MASQDGRMDSKNEKTKLLGRKMAYRCSLKLHRSTAKRVRKTEKRSCLRGKWRIATSPNRNRDSYKGFAIKGESASAHRGKKCGLATSVFISIAPSAPKNGRFCREVAWKYDLRRKRNRRPDPTRPGPTAHFPP